MNVGLDPNRWQRGKLLPPQFVLVLNGFLDKKLAAKDAAPS